MWLIFDTMGKGRHLIIMQHEANSDSAGQGATPPEGGVIPGGQGPAFVLSGSQLSSLPVLIAAPHGGRCYPPELLARMRHPEQAALRLEDRLVDLLGESVAEATGTRLLVARAPRAMIDLNRHPEDVDWDMLGLAEPSGLSLRSNARARSGLGLVPRRLPGMGEIWRGRLTRSELEARIEGVHKPYHAALAQELAAIRARWGAVLLIDLHSMPSLPTEGGEAAAQIVLGDRFGSTCHGQVVAAAFAQFAATGWRAAHNRPYAGGYVLDRHAMQRHGFHAMQLEIDRADYLDSRLVDPGAGFAATVEMLAGLVRRLGEEVARLGAQRRTGPWRGHWADAAE